MEDAARRRGVIAFCLRFLVLVTGLMVLWWWLLLPAYGAVLAWATDGIMRLVFSVPIDFGEIRTAGILNTKSLLVFGVDNRESALPIAMLVTNIPPYVALVLATLGIAWRRRLGILAAGCGILATGHLLFLVYALRFQLAARAADQPTAAFGELPTALAQLFLTLPFLLWVVLAYWHRLSAGASVPDQESPGE